jgi:hypothetical protein
MVVQNYFNQIQLFSALFFLSSKQVFNQVFRRIQLSLFPFNIVNLFHLLFEHPLQCVLSSLSPRF